MDYETSGFQVPAEANAQPGLPTASAARGLVCLHDRAALRLAAFRRLLEPWGEANGLTVLPAGPEATAGCERALLHVVILGAGGVAEPRTKGLIARIRATSPGSAIAFLSDHEERREVLAAYRAGVQGFVPMTLEPDVVLQALSLVLAGGAFFPPRLLDTAAVRSGPGADETLDRLESLTPRQRDVLELLREGKSNKNIARELDMQESTVKVHVRQIMRKLGAANRTQAALQATLSAPRPELSAADDILGDEARAESRDRQRGVVVSSAPR